MKKSLLTLFALAAMSATALAADIKPAIVYGTGGKFDKSFNEAAYNGAEKFKKETGIAYRDFEPTGDTQGEQALRNFASKGFNPVIAVSFAWTSALQKVAAEYPKTEFVLIDDSLDLPNVRSVKFKENEGSYLAGVMAALSSKTGKIGFVGGMDIPLIRKFECGYELGARAANAKIEVFQNMAGTTGAAWNDPVRGGELTKNQIDQGADVIYAAAGATGLGVLQTAADNKKLSVGVDFEPELPASGFGSDLRRQARRPRGLQCLHRRQGRQVHARHAGTRPQGRGRWRSPGRQQQAAHHPGNQVCRRQGDRRHHCRHDQGA